MTLPTERSAPGVSIYTSKVLLYGDPKVGKSTAASQIDPDHTLFITTDPAQLAALDVFVKPVRSWQEFIATIQELATTEHHFKIVVVDPIDYLTDLCRMHVLAGLSKGKPDEYVHPSDFEYGKGWDSITSEFRMQVATLCSLGMGVVFVSHAHESTVKSRSGLEQTKIRPTVGQKGIYKWLTGFVEFIFYATIVETDKGPKHVIYAKGTELIEAGGRVAGETPPLPPIISFTGEAIAKAIASATPAKEKVAA